MKVNWISHFFKNALWNKCVHYSFAYENRSLLFMSILSSLHYKNVFLKNCPVSQCNNTKLLKVPYAQHSWKIIYYFHTNSAVLLSVTLGPISSPLTLLSSGPPDQRKQIRRWQSCHGNGSSWWHPASPPQWWKWYSLAHSGQAVAGIPYIGEQERGEEDGEREREREWVKVVTQLPLWVNLTPPTERHLSISPLLLLSTLLTSPHLCV